MSSIGALNFTVQVNTEQLDAAEARLRALDEQMSGSGFGGSGFSGSGFSGYGSPGASGNFGAGFSGGTPSMPSLYSSGGDLGPGGGGGGFNAGGFREAPGEDEESEGANMFSGFGMFMALHAALRGAGSVARAQMDQFSGNDNDSEDQLNVAEDFTRTQEEDERFSPLKPLLDKVGFDLGRAFQHVDANPVDFIFGAKGPGGDHGLFGNDTGDSFESIQKDIASAKSQDKASDEELIVAQKNRLTQDEANLEYAKQIGDRSAEEVATIAKINDDGNVQEEHVREAMEHSIGQTELLKQYNTELTQLIDNTARRVDAQQQAFETENEINQIESQYKDAVLKNLQNALGTGDYGGAKRQDKLDEIHALREEAAVEKDPDKKMDLARQADTLQANMIKSDDEYAQQTRAMSAERDERNAITLDQKIAAIKREEGFAVENVASGSQASPQDIAARQDVVRKSFEDEIAKDKADAAAKEKETADRNAEIAQRKKEEDDRKAAENSRYLDSLDIENQESKTTDPMALKKLRLSDREHQELYDVDQRKDITDAQRQKAENDIRNAYYNDIAKADVNNTSGKEMNPLSIGHVAGGSEAKVPETETAKNTGIAAEVLTKILSHITGGNSGSTKMGFVGS
jgi:hypothetical protein